MVIDVVGSKDLKPKPEIPGYTIESFESVDTADEIMQLLEDAKTIEAYQSVLEALCRFYEERYNLKNEKQFKQDNPNLIYPAYESFEAFDQWYHNAMEGMHNKSRVALSLYSIVKELENAKPEKVQQELVSIKRLLAEAKERRITNLGIDDYGIGMIFGGVGAIDESFLEIVFSITREKNQEENYDAYLQTPQMVHQELRSKLQFHNDLISPKEFPRFFIAVEKRGKTETIIRVYDIKNAEQPQMLVINEPIDEKNEEEVGQRVKTFVKESLDYLKSLPDQELKQEKEKEQIISIDLVKVPSSLSEILARVGNANIIFDLEINPHEIVNSIDLYGAQTNKEWSEKIRDRRIQVNGRIAGLVLFMPKILKNETPLSERITDRYGNDIIIQRERMIVDADDVTLEPTAFEDYGVSIIIICPTPYVDDPKNVIVQETRIDLSALSERGILNIKNDLVFNVLPSAPIEHEQGIAIHTENPENYPKVREETHRLIAGAKEAESWFKAPGSTKRVHILWAEESSAHFEKVNKETMYVREPLLLTNIFDSQSTGRHEALHLIDDKLKISARPEFKEIYKKYGVLTGGVAEHQFEETAGGHPQDDETEYFASFINSLMWCCEGKNEEGFKKFTQMDLGIGPDSPYVHMLKETAQVILKRIEEIKKETKDSEPWPIEEQLKALIQFIESQLPPSAPESSEQ